ncbi:MAG: tRNA uridine-5-carboxymethylaminomethyl(34) synthesis GTPase MnmE [Pseudomonadota bacterium]
MNDTIYAEATPPGSAGISVIRVSGPDVTSVLFKLVGKVPPPRVAHISKIRHPASSEVIDEGLILYFEPGRSFTGEAVAEFQVHGSPAVVRATLSAIAAVDGTRPAERGEYTRRALEGGRVDLAQAEAIRDLVASTSEVQRRHSVRALSGSLARKVDDWRGSLTQALALLSASLDFADEEVPANVWMGVADLIVAVRSSMEDEIRGASAAERMRTGFEVAIVGPPNVGKSTLLNAIARRDAALVSPTAGTTRDVIEVAMDIDGLPVIFLDTAGLRETADTVERMGVERAQQRSQGADLRIVMGVPANGALLGADDILVHPKADLGVSVRGVPVSGLTGEGIAGLLGEVSERLLERVARVGASVTARQGEALSRSSNALRDAEARLSDERALDLAAVDVERALRVCDELLGRVGIEDVLDRVFSSFCIGK